MHYSGADGDAGVNKPVALPDLEKRSMGSHVQH